MRLALKISIAILIGVALIFSLHSYLSIQRERNQLKDRLNREALHLGQSLRVMLSQVWQLGGEQAALSFLNSSNLVSGNIKVRWVWIDGQPPQRFAPHVPANQLQPLSKGEPASILVEAQGGHDFLLTYLPLQVTGGRLGAIELSEPLDEMHGYIQESLRRSAVMLVATIASGLLLMAVLGSFWINRPLRKLTEQAERIGTGDFSTSVTVSGHDELAGLAATIDRMRNQLDESRKAELAANAAKLEALEKLRHTERLATLGRLSAGMAHELGTPLNVIAGRAKLIANQELPPDDTTRSARIICEQAERMTVIMRKLLDFARRGEPRKQAVELAGLIQGVMELLQPTARKQGVELDWDQTASPLTVQADPGQLQQVLLNLSMNGIQAMPKGGRLQLRLETDYQGQPPNADMAASGPWCRILVADQGGGIAAEHLPHIFDPFFTTKDVGQGTGLGLSIAYGIVEEHGGWIDVASTPGQGSCFSICLPQTTQGEA